MTTAHERFDAAFDTVLLHYLSHQPGVCRHLSPDHPCACGWSQDAVLAADEYRRRYPRQGNQPVLTGAQGYEDLPPCLDCTTNLLQGRGRETSHLRAVGD
jgi:hypothetical protein